MTACRISFLNNAIESVLADGSAGCMSNALGLAVVGTATGFGAGLLLEKAGVKSRYGECMHACTSE